MGNILIGLGVAIFILLIGLLLFVSGHDIESFNIANQCKSYGMATIDNKVYNCTLKEVK